MALFKLLYRSINRIIPGTRLAIPFSLHAIVNELVKLDSIRVNKMLLFIFYFKGNEKNIVLTFLLLGLLHSTSIAEKYGNKLNIGFGLGYTDYYSSLSVVQLNYELDAGRNFTLAPFITFYNYHYGYNTYRETIVPIGVKGYYYFDELLGAGPK